MKSISNLCLTNLILNNMEKIAADIKSCKSFYDFLVYVRDTDGLELLTDNCWSWLEFHGEMVEGSGKERFVCQSEVDDLLRLAGL